jgi:hypothetical protein
MDAVVSDFLLEVCQLTRQPNLKKLTTWTLVVNNQTLTAIGSCSDMYVGTIPPSDGDIDMMQCDRQLVAVQTIPHDIPRHLPPMFADTVSLLEIVDTTFACHVKLLTAGQLTRKVTGREFTFSPVSPENRRLYLPGQTSNLRLDVKSPGSGPERNISDFLGFMIYTVPSVRCLIWPAQAAEWSQRHRNHGWPDAATIERVLSNGCDLIHAVPRQNGTRRDENLWRFSFSRAETELLNSWTPKQQTVYEAFRFVVRKSDISSALDEFGRTFVKSYHLKTIMMHICELMDSIWWAQSNVVQLVVYLMHFLLECCDTSQCQGYFIPTANLFHCSSSASLVIRLQSFTDVSKLSEWFINNCIRSCAERCPDDVRRRFDDIGTIATLQSATAAIIEWEQQQASERSFNETQIVLWLVSAGFHNCLQALNGTLIRDWQKKLKDVDRRLFPEYVTPMSCLSMLSTISAKTERISVRTADILAAAVTNCDEWDLTVSMETESVCSELLRKAIGLLRLSVGASGDTRVSILFELSHAYFLLAKKHCDDGGGNVEKCRLIADCYSAVLYHVTGQHLLAVRRCERLTRSRPVAGSSHHPFVIEGRCLPRVNCDVDIARGLVMLYHVVRRACLEGRHHDRLQPVHVDVFAFDLFAHHLLLSSRSSLNYGCGGTSIRSVFRRYRNRLFQTPHVFATDLILFYMSARKTRRRCADEHGASSLSSFFKAGNLRRFVITHSVEQLTTSLQVLSREFGSKFTIATTEYEMMHAYCCGMYERCIQLCWQMIGNLWNVNNHFLTPVFGCIIHLMDDGLVSTMAVRMLISSKDTVWLVNQLTLCVYLLLESKLKLKHAIWTMVDELHLVADLFKRISVTVITDRLMLSFIYRKAIIAAVKSSPNEMHNGQT